MHQTEMPRATQRRTWSASLARVSRAAGVAFVLGCASAAGPAAVAAQATGSAPAEGAASPTVQRLHEGLLEVMRNGPELGYTGRYDRLARDFGEIFDVPYISRLLLGAQWQNLSPAQRERFVELVFQFATGTFASRFESYAGESFELEFEKPLQGTRMHVRGRFTKDDGEKLQLDYALHQRGGAWRIVDVYYDGVSGTRIQRNEFVEVIENDGIDALIEQLAGKVVLLEASAE